MTVRRTLLVIAILLACLGLDQGSKLVGRRLLSGRPPISVAGGFVRVSHTQNPGAVLSLGAWLSPAARRTLFAGVTVLGLVAAAGAALAARRIETATAVALALVAGGGFGNLVDRVVNDGRVHDFLNIGVGWLRTGVFNLADVAIVAGIVLLAVETWRTRGRKPA
jgi:signal peptidase II